MDPAHLPRAALAFILAVLGLVSQPFVPASSGGTIPTSSGEVQTSVDGTQIVRLPMAASHVAVRWPGAPDAVVTVAFGADGQTFGPASTVEADQEDQDDHAASTETYGNIMLAGGARYARLTSDRPLSDVVVLAMDSDEQATLPAAGDVVAAAVGTPTIVTRAQWGADESWRFDASGAEIWPADFEPVQKIVIHHTATPNDDPNPAATVRSIYHYDAITHGWGDMGYNFLIDPQGRIYEGRYARGYAPGEMHSEEDLAGNLVTGGHVLGLNAGVIGIAMLGTFTDRDVTPAARAALERLLAWETERHGISPTGSTTYTNPITGLRRTFPDIAGHRDVAATACPGSAFYATFPTIRADVVKMVATATGPAVDHTPPTVLSMVPTTSSPTMDDSVSFGLVFSEPVTGLTTGDFTIGGTSTGWSVTSVSGSAAIWSVRLTATTPTTGSVVLSLSADGATDLAGNAGPADAVDSAPLSWIAGLVGTVTRLAGADRYGTAAAVSAATFAPGVPVAYVASGGTFPDALAGAVAAALDGGPILLVPGLPLPPPVTAELSRLKPGRIVVLGGPAAVSSAVATALGAFTSGTVTRLAGADRYGTAAAISAATFDPGVPVAFVASGAAFPDALAGAVAAAIGKGPMILVPGTSIPMDVEAELTRLKPGRIVVLGGPAAVSDRVATQLQDFTNGTVTRLAGADRYGTAAATSAATFAPGVPVAFVASGEAFPDALAGAVAAAIGHGPILLVPPTSIPSVVEVELTRLQPARIVVLGGPDAVTPKAATALQAYVVTP